MALHMEIFFEKQILFLNLHSVDAVRLVCLNLLFFIEGNRNASICRDRKSQLDRLAKWSEIKVFVWESDGK